MLADGGDVLAGAQDHLPGGFRYADDAVTMPLQCGTQWDSLAHVFYDGKMYNDRDIRLVTSAGAAKNGIEHTVTLRVRFKQHSTRTVTKNYARGAVGVINDGRHFIRAHNHNLFVLPALNKF